MYDPVMTNKDEPNNAPWTSAMNEARTALKEAAAAETVEERDSRIRIAHAWMDIARTTE